MRLMVTLHEQEHNALWKLAEHERRDPRDQAALMIREALMKTGLLPPDSQPVLSEGLEPKPCEAVHDG